MLLKKEKESLKAERSKPKKVLKKDEVETETEIADSEKSAEAIDKGMCEVDDEVKSVKGECENGKSKQEKEGEAEL